jgi:cobalt-zinc-cadmium efflux system protein
MAHDHSHASSTASKLSLAIGVLAVGLIAQVLGAVLSGSLALAADAAHMVSDLGGLLLALFATIVAARPATDRRTFGYRRAEVLGALANGLILLILAIDVAVEGIRRLTLTDDPQVAGVPMLIVALIGGIANFSALLILRGGTGINMRAARLEVVGDLMGSAAVVVAAIVLLTTGFAQADAIASLLIAVMIVPRAISLLRDVVTILLLSTPKETDLEQIRAHVLGTSGVQAIHDVHVWQITSGEPVFTAHVVVEPSYFESGKTDQLLDELSGCLKGHFDVEHSTFQLEPAEHTGHEQTHR